MTPNLRRLAPSALVLGGALALSSCASKYAEVPARVDLAPYGRVALVTFSADHGDSSLAAVATQRFAEALLGSQSGIELLEVAASDSALQHVPANLDNGSFAQAVGREKNVPAVFLGHLTVSHVKPTGHLSASGYANVKASVSAELTVQLLSTSSGGTVWRSSAATSGTVGKVTVADGLPTVSVRDPNDAYGEMVGRLAATVTRDFRSTWVKQ
jgi:hypothetical protein